jgi:hypothetical protein
MTMRPWVLLAILSTSGMVARVQANDEIEARASNGQTAPNHKGFHIGIGAGAGTFVGTEIDEPGLLTQFKIGYGFSNHLRLYYYALNHWYSQSYRALADDGTLQGDGESEFRIAFINGLGIDYFFLPRAALRLAFGVGGDAIFSESADAAFSDHALGVAYTIGLSFDRWATTTT